MTSETRLCKTYRQEETMPSERIIVVYEGPASDVFVGGATGGGLGAVFGFLVAGTTGAIIGGALGAALGGWLGAASDEERRKAKNNTH